MAQDFKVIGKRNEKDKLSGITLTRSVVLNNLTQEQLKRLYRRGLTLYTDFFNGFKLVYICRYRDGSIVLTVERVHFDQTTQTVVMECGYSLDKDKYFKVLLNQDANGNYDLRPRILNTKWLKESDLKTINGESIVGEGNIEIKGGSEEIVDTLPSTANYGDIAYLRTYTDAPIATWTNPSGYEYVLTYTEEWNKEQEIAYNTEYSNYRFSIYVTENGGLETRIKYRQYDKPVVLEVLTKGSSGTTYYHTSNPTTGDNYKYTWDWTKDNEFRITFGASYNRLTLLALSKIIDNGFDTYEYMEKGLWAEELGRDTIGTGKDIYSILFQSIPSSVEQGMTLYTIVYGNDGGDLKLYDDRLELVSSNGNILKTIQKNGGTVPLNFYPYPYLTYNDMGVFYNYKYGGAKITNVASFQTTNFWKKINDDAKMSKSYVERGTGIPTWDDEGRITHSEISNLSVGTLFINTSGYTGSNIITQGGLRNGRFFAPTSGGTAGQVLKSTGANSAPTFVDLSSLMDNLKFKQITQDEYDNLENKDGNTIYIIIPNG
jgi:hypothetical protein